MKKCYSELIKLPTFYERYEYLRIKQAVGEATFGEYRYLNQNFYRSPEWKQFKAQIIVRDNGCDLGCLGLEIIDEQAYIHHINPITIEDILEHRPCILDPENAITTTFSTHQAIHYNAAPPFVSMIVERKPNDTCPWRA